MTSVFGLKVLSLFDPVIRPRRLPLCTFMLFVLLCLISSFTALIITATTDSPLLARDVNTGLNKLFSQSTYNVVLLRRTGRLSA